MQYYLYLENHTTKNEQIETLNYKDRLKKRITGWIFNGMKET